MSLSTPILTILSSASADVARPKAAKATSAAADRAGVFIIGVSSQILVRARLSRRSLVPTYQFRLSTSVQNRQCRQRGLLRISPSFEPTLRRRLKAQQLAGLVVVELAGLGPVRRAHRQDELGDLLGGVECHRVLAGKDLRAHSR